MSKPGARELLLDTIDWLTQRGQVLRRLAERRGPNGKPTHCAAELRVESARLLGRATLLLFQLNAAELHGHPGGPNPKTVAGDQLAGDQLAGEVSPANDRNPTHSP